MKRFRSNFIINKWTAAQVQSLVEELRSHKLRSVAKKQNNTKDETKKTKTKMKKKN